MASKLVKGIATGIGIATEAAANHREKSKTLEPSNTEAHDTKKGDDGSLSSSDEDMTHDETEWKLDEAQNESTDALEPEAETRDVQKLLDSFVQKHPPPPCSAPPTPLPLPVVLPQRRPEHKSRGFVRAYAPVLQTCGIDQAIWLDFLGGFERAIKMSPFFHAANLAVLGAAITLDVIAGPSAIAHAVAFTIHTSIEMSRRGYIQYETNKYVDGMNEQFFKPRGLYCLLMTYKPESNESIETVDISQNIARSVGSRSGEHHSKMSMLKSSSGKSTELEIPEAAPLVFPGLDAMDDGQKQSSMKKTGNFLSDYFDRRAQATFDANHPDSKLSVAPRKEFASRYADPNHPANSGSLMALATGGAFDPKTTIRQRRHDRIALGHGNTDEVGKQPSEGIKGLRQREGLLGGVKKKMHQNVLYLMVVNMPSEQEIQEATEMEQERKSQQ